MTAQWDQKTINQVADVVGRGIAPKYDDAGDMIVINQKCIRGGRVSLDTARRHDSGARKVRSDKQLVLGDVLVNSTGVGTLGRTAPVLEATTPMTADSHVTILRPREGVSSRWFGYAMSHIQVEIEGLAEGSTGQTELSRHRLGGLEVTVPPLPEQLAIAATLGALDEKIESNRRVISGLEALGSAVLEQALTLDVYGFPTYESERRLGEMVSVLETGSRPKGGASVGTEGFVSLGAESIQSAGVTATTAFKRVAHEFVDRMRRGRLADGDVLVYKDGGTPGNFTPHVSAFGYGFPVPEATINEHVYRVRGITEVSQGLLYWVLRSSWMDGEMRKRGTGVAIPGLNSTNFKELPWPLMEDRVMRDLNTILDPMLVKMLRLGSESRELASMRDILLPELLSGRIRVAAAEWGLHG